MYVRYSFESSRFELLTYERYYNPGLVPGEDVALWLRSHMGGKGFDVGEPILSHRCWVIPVKQGKQDYLVGARVRNNGLARPSGRASWQVVVEKARSRLDKMLFRNGLRPTDELCALVHGVLKQQEDFHGLTEKRTVLSP